MVHKSLDQAKSNLEASIAYIPDRWIDGVNKADWQTPASSEQAEKNYADGVAKAVTNKTRQTGIKNKPNAEWQRDCNDKGRGVIGERIRGALDKYATNFGPVLTAMNDAADRAPQKTIDFRANINSRLVPVVEAAKRAAGKL